MQSNTFTGHPVSCDTFVVLPDSTSKGVLIFGKNSDRPQGEVQEIVLVPKSTYAVGTKLQVCSDMI